MTKLPAPLSEKELPPVGDGAPFVPAKVIAWVGDNFADGVPPTPVYAMRNVTPPKA